MGDFNSVLHGKDRISRNPSNNGFPDLSGGLWVARVDKTR